MLVGIMLPSQSLNATIQLVIVGKSNCLPRRGLRPINLWRINAALDAALKEYLTSRSLAHRTRPIIISLLALECRCVLVPAIEPVRPPSFDHVSWNQLPIVMLRSDVRMKLNASLTIALPCGSRSASTAILIAGRRSMSKRSANTRS